MNLCENSITYPVFRIELLLEKILKSRPVKRRLEKASLYL